MSDDPGEVKSRLEHAEKICLMIKNFMTSLANFSRTGNPTFKTEHMGRLLKNTSHLAFQNRRIEKKLSIADNLEIVEMDPVLIREVIINLLKNSENSMNDGGLIIIKGEKELLGNGSNLPLKKGVYVKITIKDNGPGIPPEKLKNIFKPTFSAKKGFGIPLSYYIIKKHNGHFVIDSQPGEGTTCTIYIPISQNSKPN